MAVLGVDLAGSRRHLVNQCLVNQHSGSFDVTAVYQPAAVLSMTSFFFSLLSFTYLPMETQVELSFQES